MFPEIQRRYGVEPSKKFMDVGRYTVNKIARRSKRRTAIIAIILGQLLAVSVYALSDGDFKILEAYLLGAKLAKTLNVKSLVSKETEMQLSSEIKPVVEHDPQSPVTLPEETDCQLVKQPPATKFVILSATTPPGADRCARGNAECSYAFYLPLTSIAWQHFNYIPVILIAGDRSPWLESGTYLNVVYRNLMAINATVVFLPVSDDLKLTMALVGRIFVPDLVPFARQPDSYMLTSDADMIPIQNIYHLETPQEHLKVLNMKCCGVFDHGNLTKIPMFSMSGIGMRVSTWHTVMKYRELSNNTNAVERIKEAIVKEFNHLPRNVRRGDEPDWFVDQEFVSYKINQWERSYKARCQDKNPNQWGPRLQNPIVTHQGPFPRVEGYNWPAYREPHEWRRELEAHCPVPGHAWESFKYFQPLFESLYPGKLDAVMYWHEFASLVYGSSILSVAKAKEEIMNRPKNRLETINLHHPNLDVSPRSETSSATNTTASNGLYSAILLLITAILLENKFL